MSNHPDHAAEQAHIRRAYERLEAMREAARAMIGSVIAEGKGGTHQAREERDVIVRTSLARLEQLDIGTEALCFGRIDSDPDAPEAPAGVTGPESFHIGRLAVSSETHEPLVVDWRAPVAEPFYRATGAHPMGLARRRHFLTEGEQLLAIEDEVFGDGDIPSGGGAAPGTALAAALGRARTGHMRDIVATIQREQDEIIRAPLPGVLVVQGGPGTGKTAVALHRAAYLLYTHRFPLERQGVLVVGPNQLFLRYIEQVLPSLGESGAVLTTLAGLVPEARVRATERREVAALKGDERMARLIARALRDRQRPLRLDAEVGYGPHVLRFTVEESAQVVAMARRRPGPHNTRRRFVEAQMAAVLHRRYVEAEERRRARGRQGEEAPVAVADMRRYIRRHPLTAAALDRMWPRLLAEELVHDLLGSSALLASAGRKLFSPAELSSLRRPRAQSIGQIPWTAADLALIDEAKHLLGPVRPGEERPRAYGHIVVDEAQDLSPMQLRMLARRSISGSMTVVGDVAQATGASAPSGWQEVAHHLAPRRTAHVVDLTVNYRTPSEVMDLASRVLAESEPELVPPTSVRSTGVAPVRVAVAPEGMGGALAEVAARELESVQGGKVAVICPDGWEGRLAASLEEAGLDIGLPDRDGLDRPITVVPAGVVKGLEFDSVVVVEPSVLVAESARGMRALYVALTRTTQRLTVLHSSGLPAVLAGMEEPVSPAS